MAGVTSASARPELMSRMNQPRLGIAEPHWLND